MIELPHDADLRRAKWHVIVALLMAIGFTAWAFIVPVQILPQGAKPSSPYTAKITLSILAFALWLYTVSYGRAYRVEKERRRRQG